MLVAKGRLSLHPDPLTWLNSELAYPSVQLLPITPEIAVAAYRLPDTFHPDPADRLIVATAMANGCPLLTSDDRIIGQAFVTIVH